MHSFMVTAVRWCVDDDDDDLQAIIMWPPSFIDMIESMRHPLLFKHFVSFLAYVEGFTTPVEGKRREEENKWLIWKVNGKVLYYVINAILIQLFLQHKHAF